MQQICKEMIERISIHNYKSIQDGDIRLRNLNVLIGSNGVGKSNFISFFELLKALLNQRLGNGNYFNSQKDDSKEYRNSGIGDV